MQTELIINDTGSQTPLILYCFMNLFGVLRVRENGILTKVLILH